MRRLLQDRRVLLAAAAVLAVVLVTRWLPGISRNPRAPALHNGPVYKNASEGFRFLVPDGWLQYANGLVPPGRAQDECMLVEYKLENTDRPAAFSVTAIDLGNGDLEQYLVTHSPNRKIWTLSGAAQPLTINGVQATRITLRGTVPRIGNQTREVVAFRRGERVYFFMGDFASADTKAQQQIRRAVDSLIWN